MNFNFNKIPNNSFLYLFVLRLLNGQTPEELKRFMETYDKIKIDHSFHDIVKKGIESEKNSIDGPIKLLVTLEDISKYYEA